jgi:hypothetical protein
MPTRAVKAESIRTPSAATTMADRKGAFRHAEAPASGVAADSTAVVVEGIGNRRSLCRWLQKL